MLNRIAIEKVITPEDMKDAGSLAEAVEIVAGELASDFGDGEHKADPTFEVHVRLEVWQRNTVVAEESSITIEDFGGAANAES